MLSISACKKSYCYRVKGTCLKEVLNNAKNRVLEHVRQNKPGLIVRYDGGERDKQLEMFIRRINVVSHSVAQYPEADFEQALERGIMFAEYVLDDFIETGLFPEYVESNGDRLYFEIVNDFLTSY